MQGKKRYINFLSLGIVLLLMLASAPLLANAQSPCSGVTHVVQTGENLFRIGLAYGLTVDQVAAANGITNANYVQVSQVLCIPTTGTFGTGGPTANVSTGTVGQGGPVTLNSGQFIANRAINTTITTVPAGTVDSQSGYATTATVELDAANNLIYVYSYGMPPNTQVRVYFSNALGDVSGGVAGYITADAQGILDGYSEIPYLAYGDRQYVMFRGYDGRMTWGYIDIGQRFP